MKMEDGNSSHITKITKATINLFKYYVFSQAFIAEEATKLRESATDVQEALNEIQSYLSRLKNVAVEVLNIHSTLLYSFPSHGLPASLEYRTEKVLLGCIS